MYLYLIRHAAAARLDPAPDAAPADAAGAYLAFADMARPLTAPGRRRFRNVVKGLRRMDVRFDHVLHSPWRRATETADLLAPRLDGPLEPTDLLAGPPSDALLELLAARGEPREDRRARVAVVGHQPWLGELAGWLLASLPPSSGGGPGRGADANVGAVSWAWKKGGIAWLEGEPRPGGMRLRGFWAPKVLGG